MGRDGLRGGDALRDGFSEFSGRRKKENHSGYQGNGACAWKSTGDVSQVLRASGDPGGLGGSIKVSDINTAAPGDKFPPPVWVTAAL